MKTTLEQAITEGFRIDEAAKVTTKDFDRVLKIVLTGNGEEKMANSLKNKVKAVARFAAGAKLSGAKEVDFKHNTYWGPFSEFANKAIKLGASHEELVSAFEETEVPKTYFEKLAKLGGKKLDNRFVGDISALILKNGFDIEYLPHNGYAMTSAGKEAMQRNGRKWTIGYKTNVILPDGKKITFNFDAITDEGDGPTSYVVDYTSDNAFTDADQYGSSGKRKFLQFLGTSLSKLKQ